MKHVLADGEQYRQADGTWADTIDHAEPFSHDAAVIRRDELAMEGVSTRIVETSGRKSKTAEAMVMRITENLDSFA